MIYFVESFFIKIRIFVVVIFVFHGINGKIGSKMKEKEWLTNDDQNITRGKLKIVITFIFKKKVIEWMNKWTNEMHSFE